MDPQISGTELTEDEKRIVDKLQELLGSEKVFLVDQKSTLDQNISKLYGLVWGQCTLALKEDIIGLDDYIVKSN